MIDKYFSTLEILLEDSIYSQYLISLKGSCITFVFLESAGELRINILRREGEKIRNINLNLDLGGRQ